MKKNSKLNFAIKVLLTTLLIFVLLIVVVYFSLFKANFYRNDYHTEKQDLAYFGSEENKVRHESDVKWIEEQQPEEIEITSFDGLKLVSLFLPVKNGEAKGTLLLMHGYHSNPLREYATLIRFYSESGYNVVAPYQRAHGKSEGVYLTFGIKERYDCKDWITEINKRLGNTLPLFVQGISMGCATVVMTSGFEDLPFNVRGFIADCGYTSPRDIVYYVAKEEMKLPFVNVLMFICNIMTSKIADFELDGYSTFKALKSNCRPILFIHGTKDDFVPPFMTQQNFEACKSDKELYLVEGAKHAISNMYDYDNYTKKVSAFIEKYGVK